MIKQILALLFFTLLLSSLALADTRWVYSGDTFTVDNVIYTVTVGSDASRVALGAGPQTFILTLDECRDNTVLLERYCITASGMDADHNSRVRFEAGRQLFGYRLEISSLSSELKASRTVTPSPQYNQYSTIEVTLTNEGESTITGIRYTEFINSSLDLDPGDGSRQGQNFTYTRPSLAPEQSVTFRYRVRPIEHTITTLHPKLTYSFNNQQHETEINPFTISLSAPFTLTQSLSEEKPLPGEQTTYTITIRNNAQETAQYSLRTQIPQGLQVQASDFTRQNNELLLEGTIPREESIEHDIIVSSRVTGSYALATTLTLTSEGETFTRFYQQVVDVDITNLKPRIQTSRGSGTSGEVMTLRIHYENENRQALRNIHARISAPGLDESFSLDSLGSQENRLVQELQHILSNVNARTTQTIRLEGTYESIFGEEFDFSTTTNIVVRPVDDQYTITQTPSQTTFQPGDIIRMDVTIKNDESPYSFLSAEDELPFSILSGRNQIDISLSSNEERLLYSYEFRVPNNHTENIPITTNIITRDSSRSYTTTIFYEEEVYEGVQETPQEQETTTQQITAQVEEREGMLVRFWNFLRGFF